MSSTASVRLRPLERDDLSFVHQMDNNASVMRYWFEEPYEAFVELSDLTTNTFTIRASAALSSSTKAPRSAWWSWWRSITSTAAQNSRSSSIPPIRAKATPAPPPVWRWTTASVLNLYKLYLIVDKENPKAIHIYSKLGFNVEGELIDEFFVNGEYRTVLRMCIFQPQYLAKFKTPGDKPLVK